MEPNAVLKDLPTEIILKILSESARSSIKAAAQLSLVSSWSRQHILRDLHYFVIFSTSRGVQSFCGNATPTQLEQCIVGNDSGRDDIFYLLLNPRHCPDAPLTLRDLSTTLARCRDGATVYIGDVLLRWLSMLTGLTTDMFPYLPRRIDLTIGSPVAHSRLSAFTWLLPRVERIRTDLETLCAIALTTKCPSVTHIAVLVPNIADNVVDDLHNYLTTAEAPIEQVVLVIQPNELRDITYEMWKSWKIDFPGALLILRIEHLEDSKEEWIDEANGGQTLWERAEKETRELERSLFGQ